MSCCADLRGNWGVRRYQVYHRLVYGKRQNAKMLTRTGVDTQNGRSPPIDQSYSWTLSARECKAHICKWILTGYSTLGYCHNWSGRENGDAKPIAGPQSENTSRPYPTLPCPTDDDGKEREIRPWSNNNKERVYTRSAIQLFCWQDHPRRVVYRPPKRN
jgi:hypothetical protein